MCKTDCHFFEVLTDRELSIFEQDEYFYFCTFSDVTYPKTLVL